MEGNSQTSGENPASQPQQTQQDQTQTPQVQIPQNILLELEKDAGKYQKDPEVLKQEFMSIFNNPVIQAITDKKAQLEESLFAVRARLEGQKDAAEYRQLKPYDIVVLKSIAPVVIPGVDFQKPLLDDQGNPVIENGKPKYQSKQSILSDIFILGRESTAGPEIPITFGRIPLWDQDTELYERLKEGKSYRIQAGGGRNNDGFLELKGYHDAPLDEIPIDIDTNDKYTLATIVKGVFEKLQRKVNISEVDLKISRKNPKDASKYDNRDIKLIDGRVTSVRPTVTKNGKPIRIYYVKDDSIGEGDHKFQVTCETSKGRWVAGARCEFIGAITPYDKGDGSPAVPSMWADVIIPMIDMQEQEVKPAPLQAPGNEQKPPAWNI